MTNDTCFAGPGSTGRLPEENRTATPVKIGLALGGGFARGIAHAGVLKVLEERNIPIYCVAGVSAGSVAAAAFSSGATAAEIACISSAGLDEKRPPHIAWPPPWESCAGSPEAVEEECVI